MFFRYYSSSPLVAKAYLVAIGYDPTWVLPETLLHPPANK